jgi:hypothetical protein
VLAGVVSGPVGRVEHDAPNVGRLVDQLNDASVLPRQSPAYRCSFHGSP